LCLSQKLIFCENITIHSPSNFQHHHEAFPCIFPLALLHLPLDRPFKLFLKLFIHFLLLFCLLAFCLVFSVCLLPSSLGIFLLCLPFAVLELLALPYETICLSSPPLFVVALRSFPSLSCLGFSSHLTLVWREKYSTTVLWGSKLFKY
jgi:hypothetical protein